LEGARSVDDISPLLLSIDKLIRLSRLKELEFIMSSDQAMRVKEIEAALRCLTPGQYLLGTGPSTTGIIPLDTGEIVLGRPPTVVEHPSVSTADHWATDTLYFVPREVSRTHTKIVTHTAECSTQHWLIDLNSTCGTFINQTQIDPGRPGVLLTHGDIISLGPSRTNTYVYYRVDPAAGTDEEPTLHQF